MKIKYIILTILIIFFIVILFISFSGNTIEYTTFEEAKQKNRNVQIIGKWLPELKSMYDKEKNLFTFYMYDKNNDTFFVTFKGPKPSNFETASSIVVKGKIVDTTFSATQILTKCPSKYQ